MMIPVQMYVDVYYAVTENKTWNEKRMIEERVEFYFCAHNHFQDLTCPDFTYCFMRISVHKVNVV